MSAHAITRPGALPPVLVASHPRSGTHLTIDLLRRQFSSFRNWRFWGLPLDHLYLNLERLGSNWRHFDDRLAHRIVNRPLRAIMKTHFDPGFNTSWAAQESTSPNAPWRCLAMNAKIIYVIRHPLDVMASYQQFLSGIDPKIADLPLGDFLYSYHWDGSVDRLGWWAIHVQSWTSLPGVLVLRYEDIVQRTDDILEQISKTLSERALKRAPTLPPKVTSVTHTRLDRLLRLSPESTSIIADRNQFPMQDWRRALTEPERARIGDRIQPWLERFEYSLDPAFHNTRHIAS